MAASVVSEAKHSSRLWFGEAVPAKNMTILGYDYDYMTMKNMTHRAIGFTCSHFNRASTLACVVCSEPYSNK